MPFSNPLLLSHLRTGRVAHTYLFSGPEGERKEKLALGFAQALNCLNQKAFEDCACLSCRKIDKGLHPDVRRFGEDEKSRSIKIEEVRQIIHEASLRPFEGSWKVFILEGSERLTLEAANALLKTLEEPPAHSVFILLVENKAHLLETIQSRSFEIRIPPTPEGKKGDRPSLPFFGEKGQEAFWKQLQGLSRNELQEALEELMVYFREESVSSWERDRGKSKVCLKALERVYRTKEALEANVNQKLSLTYLEIGLGEVSNA